MEFYNNIIIKSKQNNILKNPNKISSSIIFIDS